MTIKEQLIEHGFSAIEAEKIMGAYILPEDEGIFDNYSKWVEVRKEVPGDLESTPCIVYCTRSFELGAATNQDWRYISLMGL